MDIDPRFWFQVYFDPKEVSYEQLLENFFDKVDPTTKDRQGNDMGTQYRSAIYYHNDQQKEAALKVGLLPLSHPFVTLCNDFPDLGSRVRCAAC